jgi:nicotinamide-nucleotide adenylyltransferase
MTKTTALFIGSFQPYHIGHHLVVQGMTKVAGRIVIGIGSSDKSGDSEHPFTAQERKEMIQATLQAEDIIPMFDINFVELPDYKDDEQWVQNVLEKVGHVDTLWTGDEWTKKCFEGRVDIQEIKEVPGISSSGIRQMMRNKEEWDEKVPAEVAKAIKDLDGLSRVKK